VDRCAWCWSAADMRCLPLEILLKKKIVTIDANFITEARDIVQRDILAIEKDFDR
jgi:hypothetical protein